MSIQSPLFRSPFRSVWSRLPFGLIATLVGLATWIAPATQSPTQAANWDCGSSFVPIVHIESVGPIHPSLQKHETKPRVQTAALAGLAAGSRWLHHIDETAQWIDEQTITSIDSLEQFAQQTLEHLSVTLLANRRRQDSHLVNQPVRDAKSQADVAAAPVQLLVGGGPMVFTIPQDYQPYDLAAGDLPRWTSLAIEFAPFELGDAAADDAFLSMKIEAVELQLALVLDEAARKRADQVRVAEAVRVAGQWVRSAGPRWNRLARSVASNWWNVSSDRVASRPLTTSR